jgi:DNA-binding NarL/FixJ family response regulator
MMVNAQKDIVVIAEAADGKDALIQVRSQRPDIVLMDVRMKGHDGIAATHAIINEGLTAQNGKPIAVIILTTFHHDEYVHAALRAGASGFLLKDAHSTEIAIAIRAVAAGDAWLNPTVTRRLLSEFASQPERQTPAPAQMTQLTHRERGVIIPLAQGQTNAEVAEQLSTDETTLRMTARLDTVVNDRYVGDNCIADKASESDRAERNFADSRLRWDFFISHTKSDRAWAEWIAWELDQAGYKVYSPGMEHGARLELGCQDAGGCPTI